MILKRQRVFLQRKVLIEIPYDERRPIFQVSNQVVDRRHPDAHQISLMCHLMACVRLPSAGAASSLASFRLSALPPRFARPGIRLTKPPRRFASLAASTARALDWDDFVRVAEEVREDEDPSDLRGYFEKVRLCNRGSVSPFSIQSFRSFHFCFILMVFSMWRVWWKHVQDLQSEFVPFLVEDRIVGYVHNRYALLALTISHNFGRCSRWLWLLELALFHPNLIFSLVAVFEWGIWKIVKKFG